MGERRLLGPETIVQTIDKIKAIRERLKSAQDRQKSWADAERRPLQFQVGKHVFLRISPTRGVIRFRSRGKLSPRFIGPFEILERVGEVVGPFEILERVGEVAYRLALPPSLEGVHNVFHRLALPPSLEGVHNVFHVSQLRRYVRDETHILDIAELQIGTNLSYEERPMKILDKQEKVLKNRTISLVLVSWGHHGLGKATWEREDDIRQRYPDLFTTGDF
ncbi:uncharacterized protein LOC109821475 [Asparagus officinalis]|uniref:uncharacterized protein LOC109821475 n=1 Tax=Asparagus officinalis TaxID=4686 RepID=UPI00098E396D|nr:uncharacterized protein LOC109821475 [Asparagus officinalis]